MCWPFCFVHASHFARASIWIAQGWPEKKIQFFNDVIKSERVIWSLPIVIEIEFSYLCYCHQQWLACRDHREGAIHHSLDVEEDFSLQQRLYQIFPVQQNSFYKMNGTKRDVLDKKEREWLNRYLRACKVDMVQFRRVESTEEKAEE